MSDISLPALVENSKKIDLKMPTPMQQVNLALKECGFGWFHIQMLFTSYFGFSAGVLISNTSPYILPIAECDLDMNLLRKGILTAVPYIGMIFSSVIAGFLTDTFGRKIFLVGGYTLMAIFNIVTALSQTYSVMIFSKFCEGFVFAVAFSPTMTFTSEFCHNEIRDRVMLLQSAFAPTAQIVLAGITWAILMNDWTYTLFDGYIVMNTWNFYLLVMVIFSASAAILYCFLPESPKYLVTQHRYDEARDVLIYVYQKNTGKPADTFKYASMWKDKISSAIEEGPEHEKTTISQQLTAGLQNVKPLFQKPHGHYLLLFCCMNFMIMCLYNVIRMWFPQLSTVVEHYSVDHDELCAMLDSYTSDLRLRSLNTTVNEICVPTKSGTETYINSIIVGVASLPSYFFLGLVVNKVGKKRLLIIAGLLSVACSLGLRWSNSKPAVVALFAADMAVGQAMMSLLQATTVEFFPTSIRTIAISTTMTVGRTGSLIGNILFPILLDLGCVWPFFSFAGIMVVVTIMAIIAPSKK